VWLLLTRHTTRKQQGKDDFLTVHVFKQRGGRRVYHLETCWLQGVYTNRPHCLVKFDVDPGTHTLTLALAQYKAVPHQVDYTLNVYSMAPFALRTLPMGLRHALHAKGRWHGIAAGGCQNYDSYIDNPRYLLTVAEPTDVLLELQCLSDSFSLGLDVDVVDGGETAQRNQFPLKSGTFRVGHAMVEARFPKGKYSIVPATFKPAQEAEFVISASSSAPISLVAVDHEGRGLVRHLVKGAWRFSDGSAAGSPNGGRFARNPHFRLTLSHQTDVLLRLQANNNPARPAMCITVYEGGERRSESGARFSNAMCVSNSGVYANFPGGVHVPRTALAAGSYSVIVSTFDPIEAEFTLIVYAAQGALRVQTLA